MSSPTIFHLEKSGFPVYGLRNDSVEVGVMPDLGARISSLVNLKTGREWMWQPPGLLNLLRNEFGDSFDCAPLVGLDECLPTISPCSWHGISLPDHGEVWSLPWQLDEGEFEKGRIRTSVETPLTSLSFERSLSLDNNSLILDYRLENFSGDKREFLWSLHPLLEVREGDQIELPEEATSVLVESKKGMPGLTQGSVVDWPNPVSGVSLDCMDLGSSSGACIKLFAELSDDGCVGITSLQNQEGLIFEFDTQENPALGIWISRGGWNGYEHLALEPTNLPFDSLTEHGRVPRPPTLQPCEHRTWTVVLRLV